MDFPSESTKARAMHTIRFLALQLLEHAAGSPLNQGANLKGDDGAGTGISAEVDSEPTADNSNRRTGLRSDTQLKPHS
jgi:hypothetical protein